MSISIAAFSFHGLKSAGLMDVFGYLETCRYRYGLGTADIWNGLIDRDPEVYLNDAFPAKLVGALAERELTVVNYHADGCHAWENEPAAREKNHSLALRHLKFGAQIGAKTVRIDAGSRGQTWTDEQFDFIVQKFKEYCRIAGDAGMKVGPESHWGPELVPDNMERLAKAVASPAFGILLHIGHWENAPIEEGDRRLAKYAAHTHVDQKTSETRLESAMKILLDAGYTGCWGVEHHTGKNEYAEVAVQLALVKRQLAKFAAEGVVVRTPGGKNDMIPEGV